MVHCQQGLSQAYTMTCHRFNASFDRLFAKTFRWYNCLSGRWEILVRNDQFWKIYAGWLLIEKVMGTLEVATRPSPLALISRFWKTRLHRPLVPLLLSTPYIV